MRTHAALAAALGTLALTPATASAADTKSPSPELREAYDRIHDRVKALGGTPGRDIVEDGVRRDGEARGATRREVIRSLRVLRRTRDRLTAPAATAPARASAPTSVAGGSSGGGGGASAGLEAIAACESGGNPSAVSPDGRYRGKYQFDAGTWASVGGSGDPAAAPEAEQDRRAAALAAQRGSSPWPVCGG